MDISVVVYLGHHDYRASTEYARSSVGYMHRYWWTSRAFNCVLTRNNTVFVFTVYICISALTVFRFRGSVGRKRTQFTCFRKHFSFGVRRIDTITSKNIIVYKWHLFRVHGRLQRSTLENVPDAVLFQPAQAQYIRSIDGIRTSHRNGIETDWSTPRFPQLKYNVPNKSRAKLFKTIGIHTLLAHKRFVHTNSENIWLNR